MKDYCERAKVPYQTYANRSGYRRWFHPRQYFHGTCVGVQRGHRTATAGHAFRGGDCGDDGYGICSAGAEGILGRMMNYPGKSLKKYKKH